jgi:uncharacterized repeat protein (TIGR04076 family)
MPRQQGPVDRASQEETMPNCKITVLRRTLHLDLMDEYLDGELGTFDRCSAFHEGQEFIIEGFPAKPEGFCDGAWAGIHTDVTTMIFGGSYPWIQQPGTAITCCTDGLRPVIFKVERVD